MTAPPPIPPIGEGYRVEDFAATSSVGVEDVLEFWAREGAVDEEEARRRVDEVLLVATGPAAELVGVSTAYLHRNHQLGMDLWYFRYYVSAAHRRHQIARHLFHGAKNVLAERFVSGQDTRGPGMILEVENEDLRRERNEAVTARAGSIFIGENGRGDLVRVLYFPGALVPLHT